MLLRGKVADDELSAYELSQTTSEQASCTASEQASEMTSEVESEDDDHEYPGEFLFLSTQNN